MKNPVTVLGCIALPLFMLGCSSEPEPEDDQAKPTATVVDDSAMANETAGENWLAFGRTYNEQRFSPLEQINDNNVAELNVDWYLDLPEARGLVSTPLVVDGVMYFVASMNRVRAVDAGTDEWVRGAGTRGPRRGTRARPAARRPGADTARTGPRRRSRR